MALISNLFDAPSGNLAGLNCYRHIRSHCVRKSIFKHPVSEVVADNQCYMFSAAAVLASFVKRSYVAPYFPYLSLSHSYFSDFLRINRAAIFPEFYSPLCHVTWGPLSPVLLLQRTFTMGQWRVYINKNYGPDARDDDYYIVKDIDFNKFKVLNKLAETRRDALDYITAPYGTYRERWFCAITYRRDPVSGVITMLGNSSQSWFWLM